MTEQPDPRWYQDAVIYQAHVRGFFDSNNDGVGDFAGLTEKLEYLQNLGVNCIWLQPFYPSPLRDDGYDIADYENIHPGYGTLDDFDKFVAEAHRRGIRVITELVINHTSDQHPWFQAARRAPAGSAARDFYVWSDTNQKYQGARIIFTDTETSNWQWDDTAKAYYWHRFFHHQPDLNFDNPAVLEAVLRVMQFWLDRGVDGLRLDAVPYLIEREGTTCENLDETHAVLKQIRAALDRRYPDRMLLAEANQWPADVRPYFGDGDECHMAFHFPLMPRMFMAIRQEDRHPIVEILRQTPDIPESCQWAMFLRNHDELTLEMVTDEERDYMYQAYAADPQMRINVGIRRRLAPLLENSPRRIELLHSLLFSMPGTPILYYGDELGMGDNIYLGDRHGVRTPMQWTGDRNGGFSRADPARLYAPPIMDPVYGYQAINVEAQERTPSSLLNWMKRVIGLRKQSAVFGRGSIEFLPAQNRKILAFVRRYQGEDILCIANLARTVQPVELDLSRFKGMTPVEMVGSTEFPRIGELPYFLTLGPYAFYLFRVQQAPAPLTVRVPAEVATEAVPAPALFVGASWDTLLEGNVRTLIERDLLLPFLERQRWFGGKGRQAVSARFADWGLLSRAPQPMFLTMVEVAFKDGAREQYFLPLTACAAANGASAASGAPAPGARPPNTVLATITGARKGLLFDAWGDASFARTLLESIAGDRPAHTRRGVIHALKTAAFDRIHETFGEPLAVSPLSAEQTNTSIVYGDRHILKLFRRIQPGLNPEFEIGRVLAEGAPFARVPAVTAGVEYLRHGEEPSTVAVLQQFVESQADGWSHALGEVDRFYDEVQGDARPADFAHQPGDAVPPQIAKGMGAYLATAETLGRRTAELHLALANAPDPAFAPEPMSPRDLELMADDAAGQAERALSGLESSSNALPPDLAGIASRLLRSRDQLIRHARSALGLHVAASKIRIHGDYHLGQVLWAEGDFYIIDFEGEPDRPIAERRLKQSPLKDVAGMLRSFSYAAYAGLFSRTASGRSEFAQVEPWARVWQSWAASAFLRGYFDAAGRASFLPASPVDRDALLNISMLDKALYELNYELHHRPDWMHIPLRGIFDLLQPRD